MISSIILIYVVASYFVFGYIALYSYNILKKSDGFPAVKAYWKETLSNPVYYKIWRGIRIAVFITLFISIPFITPFLISKDHFFKSSKQDRPEEASPAVKEEAAP